jgi:hypothetical protein
MSATELEEVQALLERVLPDPSGFAQRLLQQVVAQWGQSAEPGARAFHTAATAEGVRTSATVIPPDQPAADETPVDTNLLLAAALGACECWGLRADCRICRGQGSSGWTKPEPELFEELVGPAITRLSDISAGGPEQDGSVKADQHSDKDRIAQGENA